MTNKVNVQTCDASREDLEKLFNAADINGNGLIDEKELANVLVSAKLPPNYSKLCMLLVAGGKKEINIEQFDKFIDVLTMYKTDRKEFYDLIFEVFDADENGSIDLDELLLFLEYLGIELTPGQVVSILSQNGVNIANGLSQPEFTGFLIGLDYGLTHPN
ncbi:centrin, EF-hand protein [Tritrichomonas musculus]|uniref:Centrin, EF-hand protein n=1 Tax=Tritrichomonas musculus TaxID=1915356 RepID=A0ABR2IKH5_9EUKA